MSRVVHIGETAELEMHVGDRVTLQSMRQAVVPPFHLLIPFIDLNAPVVMEGQCRVPGEGVHGVDYELRASSVGSGRVVVGFKDLRTQQVTHEKELLITVK